MLKNLPIYLKSFADDHSLLSELQNENNTSLKDNLRIRKK